MAASVGKPGPSSKELESAQDEFALGETAEKNAEGFADTGVAAVSKPNPAANPPIHPKHSESSEPDKLDRSGEANEHSGILANAYESRADVSADGAGLSNCPTSAASPSPPSIPFRSSPGIFPVAHWERYEFLSVLGRGGMGAVYKAKDCRNQQTVALKFVHGNDEILLKRFLHEAKALSRIDHPGICKVLDIGEVEGKSYIAMQFVDGQNLQQARQLLSFEE